MLTIIIPGTEIWDDNKEEFINSKDYKLVLEHSLVSISKWESKWHKPFINDNERSEDEIRDYVKCMTVTQHVPDIAFQSLTKQNLKEISEYINDERTATWFNTNKTNSVPSGKQAFPKREAITSELIYYWMISLEIPFECQRWHLNRLLTLIKICNIKNNKSPKKVGRNQQLRNNAALNAARRKQHHSRG